MAADDCIRSMREAAPDLSLDEIDELIVELRKQKKRVEAAGVADDLQSDALKAADLAANRMKLAAVIEKRNAAINLARQAEVEAFVVGNFETMPREGFFALLAGTQRLRVGGRMSAAAEAKGFQGAWMGGIAREMEAAGVWKVFESGTMDREVSRALWAFGQDNAPEIHGRLPREAVDIATIVHKYQEIARTTQNRFGAWVRPLPGYIVRQTHDMFKIHAAGFEEWRKGIESRLDWVRIEQDNPDIRDRGGWLRAVYNDLSTGVHTHETTARGEPAPFKGPANLAKKASQERTLHFLGPDEWFDYNLAFGQRTLSEGVIMGLASAARTSGLLKVFGTNPEYNLKAVMSRVSARLDGEARTKFQADQQQVLDLLTHVDGRAAIPGNHTAARVGATLRAIQSMAKLGGAVISSITDIPFKASEMKFSRGQGYLSGMAESIGDVFRGRPAGERRDMAESLGVYFESMMGGVFARFDAQDLTGKTTTMLMQKFFKWNGLQWWTETHRSAFALSQAHYLARQAGKGFGKLDAETQRTLSLYRISEPEWELIRKHAVKLADGREYMTPEAIADIPDAEIEAYLAAAGKRTTGPAVANTRDDLAQQMRVFYVDRATHAVIEPDARSTWWLQRGSKPGTLWGEVARYVAQFKGFPTAVITKVLGREVYGRGADELRQVGMSEMAGIAQLILTATAFGYGAMAIKDVIKGREPRDPTTPDVWLAAMLQGGALGIYGDFLLGESSRFGSSPLETAAGPTIGTASDLIELAQKVRSGDDAAAQAFRLLIANTPFANLFYTRVALDYLILYRIQEALNPGYLRRMEQRIERENNQTFWLRPSEVAY